MLNIKKISQLNEEMLRSQLEIQEQTMKNISQEIHDNIGQMLSLAKMTLGTTDVDEKKTAKKKIGNAEQLVAKSITDLRNLSRSLDTDHISSIGLQDAVAFELEQLEKAGRHKTILNVSGDLPLSLDKQKELILFRIIQECLHNIIKHAAASEIKVNIQGNDSLAAISLSDNGKGFIMEEAVKGLGLRNMQNRAKLIGATLNINSTPGKGTLTTIILPL